MNRSTTYNHHRNGGRGHYHQNRRFSSPQPQFHHHHHNNNNNYHNNHNNNENNKNDNRPKFTIHLRNTAGTYNNNDQQNAIHSVVSECGPLVPDGIDFRSGSAFISFHRWSDALSFTASLWAHRLGGFHTFSPQLQRGGLLPSDVDDLNKKLKAVFMDHVRGLIEGEKEPLMSWQSKLQGKVDEIEEVKRSMRPKHNPLRLYRELTDRSSQLGVERELIEKRIGEFKSAMTCVLEYLEFGAVEVEEDRFKVFSFDGEVDWEKLHWLLLRETRRLQDGLPIYIYRQDILRMIARGQVMVLIGETGSGKSTQLAQFLADSGMAANGSIVCTQPRKIAAFSLADRVKEESKGCYGDGSVVCFPAFSSTRQFASKVIFMTDHCLLQHYILDRDLSGISCIIVDEAHERSLHTDLLLALIKLLLLRRLDLRLVIMSATADAKQLSEYFFGSETFHVLGRNYPVDIQYVPFSHEGTASGAVAPYVHEVVRMATEVHRKEKEGTVLAFLTSQMEVEWASEQFNAPFAVPLALHGKLSSEEQFRVFQNYPGKRKVIFATNLAETSLTIPGVKYVVDSGMAKESKFEPGSGMNVLRVGWISKSSAKQRAGRAGRTGSGICYRLYSECDFEAMCPYQEPEIRRVHLGVAVLRILASGIKNMEEFEFVDSPSTKAIDMATRNLVQLSAVAQNNGNYDLTDEGHNLVRLGIEPRLGKLILNCSRQRLGKEGLVVAAVMANSSSIFCRVGSNDDKQKSDRLKVQFCHRNGDLFTLLSVYKEWEAVSPDQRNKWCWDNSINAKSMRRCQETVKELEHCLQKELSVVIPSYWNWNPNRYSEYEKYLKSAILSALPENVAMFSGYDQLGYEVALTGQHVQLHPSCSLLSFGEKPSWVVFSELLSMTSEYLVCVTAFDFELFSMLGIPPPFDALEMQSRKLQVKVMSGFGSTLLKKFCGKANCNLLSLVSRLRANFMDERIGVEVHVDQNEILLFATAENMEKAASFVRESLAYQGKLLRNECLEKALYLGGGMSSPVALFGAGAEIKHLELNKRCLTIDLFHPNRSAIDEKELFAFVEKYASGTICSVHKSTGTAQDSDETDKWGSITFLDPDAVRKSSKLNELEFNGSLLRVVPAQTTFGADHRTFPFAAVRAKVMWPRRCSKGVGFVKCLLHEVHHVLDDFSELAIGGKLVRCGPSNNSPDSIVITGFDRELAEDDIWEAVRSATKRRILDFFMVRGDAVENPPLAACEGSLLKELTPFIPNRNPHSSSCMVQICSPEPKDACMRALITFDGRLHLEAAKALEHLEGKVLPGFRPWQKIKCQRLFHSSLSCSSFVYFAVERQLLSLVARFNRLRGTECSLEKNTNGSYRVKISANGTKRVAELRRPLEELMKGRILNHASLTPSVLQHLFSKDVTNMMKSIQRETGTHILFARHFMNVRIFGSSDRIDLAEQKLVESLLAYHESKQLEIHLRGPGLPSDLMKEVVKAFRPDLNGLKEKVPGADFSLNTRHHVISMSGDKELKPKVEEIIFEIARASHDLDDRLDKEAACPICLCEVEDGYRLEDCTHLFCRLCLVDQLESAARNLDSFPVCCAREGCRAPILLADLKQLLSCEKLEELFRASLGAFVASSGGKYRFCPSPDCPSVYRVADPDKREEPFTCGACYAETCTRCHLEYHPYLSCEKYREFKEDPDLSLKDWCKGKENVKSCPVCGYTIEKGEGCNHVECRCGKHICWVCLAYYNTGDDCYEHLRSVHNGIN